MKSSALPPKVQKIIQRKMFFQQLKLTESGCSLDKMQEYKRYFQPTQYDNLVEERVVSGKCGWPPCNNPLETQRHAGKLRISLGQHRVYKTTNSCNYCSSECIQQSLGFRSGLSMEPLFTRPVFKDLLAYAETVLNAPKKASLVHHAEKSSANKESTPNYSNKDVHTSAKNDSEALVQEILLEMVQKLTLTESSTPISPKNDASENRKSQWEQPQSASTELANQQKMHGFYEFKAFEVPQPRTVNNSPYEEGLEPSEILKRIAMKEQNKTELISSQKDKFCGEHNGSGLNVPLWNPLHDSSMQPTLQAFQSHDKVKGNSCSTQPNETQVKGQQEALLEETSLVAHKPSSAEFKMNCEQRFMATVAPSELLKAAVQNEKNCNKEIPSNQFKDTLHSGFKPKPCIRARRRDQPAAQKKRVSYENKPITEDSASKDINDSCAIIQAKKAPAPVLAEKVVERPIHSIVADLEFTIQRPDKDYISSYDYSKSKQKKSKDEQASSEDEEEVEEEEDDEDSNDELQVGFSSMNQKSELIDDEDAAIWKELFGAECGNMAESVGDEIGSWGSMAYHHQETVPSTFVRIWDAIDVWATMNTAAVALHLQRHGLDSVCDSTVNQKNSTPSPDEVARHNHCCQMVMAQIPATLKKLGITKVQSVSMQNALTQVLQTFSYSSPTPDLKLIEWKLITVILVLSVHPSLELNLEAFFDVAMAEEKMSKIELIWLQKHIFQKYV